MKDGHLNKCIECAKIDARGCAPEQAVTRRAYERKRSQLPHRIELRERVVKAWAKMYPERKAAHAKLRYAMKRGMVTQLPCMVCGESAEAHHPDYSRPLDVVWLCSSHHKQAHAITNREG